MSRYSTNEKILGVCFVLILVAGILTTWVFAKQRVSQMPPPVPQPPVMNPVSPLPTPFPDTTPSPTTPYPTMSPSPYSLFYFSILNKALAEVKPLENKKTKAMSLLSNKSGSNVTGRVDFEEIPEGLKVNYKISGLEKNKTFGFHIHEKGDCSSPDAKSAGKHYLQIEPTGGTSLDSPEKHAGDLPQIQSDSKGIAKGDFITPYLSINKVNAVNNKAIIVHGGPDNPIEKSPPRIACGVVKAKRL